MKTTAEKQRKLIFILASPRFMRVSSDFLLFKMEIFRIYKNPDMFVAVRHFFLFVFNISSGNELRWRNQALIKQIQRLVNLELRR